MKERGIINNAHGYTIKIGNLTERHHPNLPAHCVPVILVHLAVSTHPSILKIEHTTRSHDLYVYNLLTLRMSSVRLEPGFLSWSKLAQPNNSPL